MPAPLSIDAIEDAIQHADPKTRHQTLRAVTDLFMSSAPSLDDSKVGIFDNLFDSLLDDSELEGVLDVSKRMAPIGNAPPRLVRRLLYMSTGGNQCCESDRVLRHLPRS